MSINNRSVGFAGIVDWVCSHRRWWFSFVESVVLTGLLQYSAWHFRTWPLFTLWVVSVFFLVAPIVRTVFEAFRVALDRLPWHRIETLPRIISYPAMVVFGLTIPMVTLIVADYTTLQIANVIDGIAKSHVVLH